MNATAPWLPGTGQAAKDENLPRPEQFAAMRRASSRVRFPDTLSPALKAR
jgi:hypothetical protein